MSYSDSDNEEEVQYVVEFKGDQQQYQYLLQDGFGKATFANKDTYEGEYRDGKRHGQGTYTFASGGSYSGGYVCGRKEGTGVFTAPDGGVYDGAWTDDKRNGFGTYTYPNGDKYVGEWLADKKHGQGTYTYTQSSKGAGCSVTGVWRYGLCKHGQWSHADGTRMLGAFSNNTPTGKAVYTYRNGNVQSGEYVRERVMIDEDGDDEDPDNWTQRVSWRSDGIGGDTRPSLRAQPPAPAPVSDAVLIARAIAKSVPMRCQHSGIERIDSLVPGVPNARRVGDSGSGVYACGQPSVSGIRRFLELVSEDGLDRVVWLSLRSSPCVFVDDQSYTPRDLATLSSQLTLHPRYFTRVQDQMCAQIQVASVEDGNVFTYYQDTYDELPAGRRSAPLTHDLRPNAGPDGYEDDLADDDDESAALRGRGVVTLNGLFAQINEDGSGSGVDVELVRLPLSAGADAVSTVPIVQRVGCGADGVGVPSPDDDDKAATGKRMLGLGGEPLPSAASKDEEEEEEDEEETREQRNERRLDVDTTAKGVDDVDIVSLVSQVLASMDDGVGVVVNGQMGGEKTTFISVLAGVFKKAKEEADNADEEEEEEEENEEEEEEEENEDDENRDDDEEGDEDEDEDYEDEDDLDEEAAERRREARAQRKQEKADKLAVIAARKAEELERRRAVAAEAREAALADAMKGCGGSSDEMRQGRYRCIKLLMLELSGIGDDDGSSSSSKKKKDVGIKTKRKVDTIINGGAAMLSLRECIFDTKAAFDAAPAAETDEATTADGVPTKAYYQRRADRYIRRYFLAILYHAYLRRCALNGAVLARLQAEADAANEAAAERDDGDEGEQQPRDPPSFKEWCGDGGGGAKFWAILRDAGSFAWE